MGELKLCPFCGMNYAENAWDECGSEYWVCEFCGAASGTARDEYGWQTRPIEDDLRKRIAELEAAQRWIPVSERLPEDGKPVWVCTIWNEQHSGFLIDGVWGGLFRDFREGEITHWLPLPVLPESPNDTQTQTFVYGKDVSRSVK